MVTVREATTSDTTAVSAVHEAAIRELGAAAYDDEQVAAWQRGCDPDYPVDRRNVRFVVAVRDRTVVGFGEARSDPPDYLGAHAEGEVRAVYVHPDAAREGVGSAVLRDLERWARPQVDSLGLHASLNAVAFYEAHGYERVAERTHRFGGEVPGTVVEMHTDLRRPARDA